MNYTYMLECADGSLYTGWTNDLQKRLAAHQAGKGGRYTRSRLPVRMVYAEAHEEKKTAMQREYQIKHLTRSKKLALLESPLNCIPKE